MIIRIHPSGRSFKGLANYICHDPGADTAQRVAWTHSLNCAHDDELSVVHEMYTTTMDADLLKQEAGGRAGYAPIKKPAKHLSLSWHPSDEPTQEHMIEATQKFLRHMGWQDHQAFLVAHNDKDHAHIHVMLNAIHPETGLKLDDSFERRRAQEWALEYERSQDRIHCEQRLLDPEDRQPQMSRDAWQSMKDGEARLEQEQRRHYDPGYMAREDNRKVIAGEEWKILKDYQRQEREAFFAENKELYRNLAKAVYREVREEFKHEWAGYYADKRARFDWAILALERKDILDRQKAMFAERRDEAMAVLKQERDSEYADLRAMHREEKADLRGRQAEGQTSPHLLDLVNRTPENSLERLHGATQDTDAFAPGRETLRVDVASIRETEQAARSEILIDPALVGTRAASGFADRGASEKDGLFSEAVAEATAASSHRTERGDDNPFSRSAETARRHAEREEKEEEHDRSYSSYSGRIRD